MFIGATAKPSPNPNPNPSPKPVPNPVTNPFPNPRYYFRGTNGCGSSGHHDDHVYSNATAHADDDHHRLLAGGGSDDPDCERGLVSERGLAVHSHRLFVSQNDTNPPSPDFFSWCPSLVSIANPFPGLLARHNPVSPLTLAERLWAVWP